MGPKLDQDKCEGCGSCVEVCPAGVFELNNGKAEIVDLDACLDCGSCAEECPPLAITIED